MEKWWKDRNWRLGAAAGAGARARAEEDLGEGDLGLAFAAIAFVEAASVAYIGKSAVVEPFAFGRSFAVGA